MNYWDKFKNVSINVNFDDVYVQCDVGNVVNVRFKDETKENRHFTDHVQVAHAQNVAHDQKI